MKIHGTAKGGAISKKDFGVAFGGVPAPDPLLASYTDGGDVMNIGGGAIPKRAEVVVNTSSAWYGLTVNRISFQVRKYGSPTGTFYVRIWDSSSVVKLELGSGTIEDLTTSFVWTDFTGASSYTLAVGDRIGLEYSGGTWADDVLQCQGITTSDAYDPPNTTQYYQNTAGTWIAQTDHDINFKLWYV